MTLAPRPLRTRGSALVALALAVLVLHACVVDRLADTVAGWDTASAAPALWQVSYVREMVPTTPLPASPLSPAPAAPVVGPPRSPRAVSGMAAAVPAEPAASLPLPSPVIPDEVPVADAVAPPQDPASEPPRLAEPVAVATSSPIPGESVALPAMEASGAAVDNAARVAAGVAAPSASAASAPAFAWPASTRLTYRLSGQYRGEIHGSAQVEWVLKPPRYQIRLDVTVGLPFAPLYTRRLLSTGLLTDSGLRPERYDEDSQLAFRPRRQARLSLDADGSVRLADGSRWQPPPASAAPDPAMPDATVQDSASQFVQLAYLFTREPQRLAPGAATGFRLALPRRVEPWVYEAIAPQTLYTPFGPVEAVHMRPRRGTARGNDLLAEAWFSPQLAYLPVRIRIEQDAETFLDLVIDRRPELAAN